MTAAVRYQQMNGQQTTCWDELISEYLIELAAGGKPATTIRLRRQQLSYMARCLDMPIEKVTTRSLLGWVAAQSWARETRRSYRSGMRAFFGWCYEHGYIWENPALMLPIITQRAGVPRPIPEQAYQQAIAAAPVAVGLMIRLAGEMGLRRGEIAQVSSRDVLHGSAGYSLLVHGKGDKDRVIPLPDGLADEVRRAGGWLFRNGRGSHVSADWVGEVCARWLPGSWSLHCCRHRFATRAYAASHDLRAVQILLGHSSPAVTQRYVAVEEADLRAVIAAAG